MISHWKWHFREQGDEAFPGTGHLPASEPQVRDLQRENGAASVRARYIEKSAGHLLGGTVVARYRFIDEHRTQWSVEEMCRVLEVSRGGFHAWKNDPTVAAR